MVHYFGEASSPEALRAFKKWVDESGLDPSAKLPGDIARSAYLTGWLEGRNDLRARRKVSNLRKE